MRPIHITAPESSSRCRSTARYARLRIEMRSLHHADLRPRRQAHCGVTSTQCAPAIRRPPHQAIIRARPRSARASQRRRRQAHTPPLAALPASRQVHSAHPPPSAHPSVPGTPASGRVRSGTRRHANAPRHPGSRNTLLIGKIQACGSPLFHPAGHRPAAASRSPRSSHPETPASGPRCASAPTADPA